MLPHKVTPLWLEGINISCFLIVPAILLEIESNRADVKTPKKIGIAQLVFSYLKGVIKVIAVEFLLYIAKNIKFQDSISHVVEIIYY